jgi:hypothetical protein
MPASSPSQSPHPNDSIPLDILSQPSEERIKFALKAIRESGTKPNGDPIYSARKAERDFNIPRSTLGFRLRGMYIFYHYSMLLNLY